MDRSGEMILNQKTYEIMKCVICKTGNTKQGKVTVTVDIKGTVVVIRDVPEKVQQAVKKGVEIEVIRINAA